MVGWLVFPERGSLYVADIAFKIMVIHAEPRIIAPQFWLRHTFVMFTFQDKNLP